MNTDVYRLCAVKLSLAIANPPGTNPRLDRGEKTSVHTQRAQMFRDMYVKEFGTGDWIRTSGRHGYEPCSNQLSYAGINAALKHGARD